MKNVGEMMKKAEEAKFKQDVVVICRRAAKIVISNIGGQLLEHFTGQDWEGIAHLCNLS